jgi:hypothetical protein
MALRTSVPRVKTWIAGTSPAMTPHSGHSCISPTNNSYRYKSQLFGPFRLRADHRADLVPAPRTAQAVECLPFGFRPERIGLRLPCRPRLNLLTSQAEAQLEFHQRRHDQCAQRQRGVQRRVHERWRDSRPRHPERRRHHHQRASPLRLQRRRPFRHPVSNPSGQASVWEMNGNSLIGGGPVSPNPGASWRAVGA